MLRLATRIIRELTVNYRKFSMKEKDLWKIHVQFTVIYVAPHSGNKETIISSNSRYFILCPIGNFRSIEDHFSFIGMAIPINIFYSLI